MLNSIVYFAAAILMLNVASTAANGLLRQLDNNTAHYMRGDGTWQTPPNTNTWRPIQNVLTSSSTTDSLSANMGKALKDQIGNFGTNTFQNPFSRFTLTNGIYIIYGARIYSGVNVNTSYTSGGHTAYFYNFNCSLGTLVPNSILGVVATAHCNGGLYAVSTATTSKTNISGFIWAPGVESNKSISLNLVVLCY